MTVVGDNTINIIGEIMNSAPFQTLCPKSQEYLSKLLNNH